MSCNFISCLRVFKYILNYRATNEDFKKSGYDRGHLAAAGNHRWSQDLMEQTFLLSNMAPQVNGSLIARRTFPQKTHIRWTSVNLMLDQRREADPTSSQHWSILLCLIHRSSPSLGLVKHFRRTTSTDVIFKIFYESVVHRVLLCHPCRRPVILSMWYSQLKLCFS